MDLVTIVYKLTKSFPKEEIYGLTSQIRRTSISLPSNIAEGYGRKSTNDYLRFLQIAMGALFELQTQLEISKNLDYLDKDAFSKAFEKAKEIERMLSSLINKISN